MVFFSERFFWGSHLIVMEKNCSFQRALGETQRSVVHPIAWPAPGTMLTLLVSLQPGLCLTVLPGVAAYSLCPRHPGCGWRPWPVRWGEGAPNCCQAHPPPLAWPLRAMHDQAGSSMTETRLLCLSMHVVYGVVTTWCAYFNQMWWLCSMVAAGTLDCTVSAIFFG